MRSLLMALLHCAVQASPLLMFVISSRMEVRPRIRGDRVAKSGYTNWIAALKLHVAPRLRRPLIGIVNWFSAMFACAACCGPLGCGGRFPSLAGFF